MRTPAARRYEGRGARGAVRGARCEGRGARRAGVEDVDEGARAGDSGVVVEAVGPIAAVDAVDAPRLSWHWGREVVELDDAVGLQLHLAIEDNAVEDGIVDRSDGDHSGHWQALDDVRSIQVEFLDELGDAGRARILRGAVDCELRDRCI